MKILFLILLLSFPVHAADFTDEIPTKQEFENDLEPAKKPYDYEARATVTGDIDADGNDEQVIIVQSAPGYPQQSMLIFKGDDLWKVGNSHVIEDSEGMLDPHGIVWLDIKKGILELATGPWGASCTQKWRGENGNLRLIGLTQISMSRNCACGTIIDTNYLTGQTIMTSDRGPDGTQLEKERIVKTKKSPQTIWWEDFNYKKFCASEN